MTTGCRYSRYVALLPLAVLSCRTPQSGTQSHAQTLNVSSAVAGSRTLIYREFRQTTKQDMVVMRFCNMDTLPDGADCTKLTADATVRELPFATYKIGLAATMGVDPAIADGKAPSSDAEQSFANVIKGLSETDIRIPRHSDSGEQIALWTQVLSPFRFTEIVGIEANAGGGTDILTGLSWYIPAGVAKLTWNDANTKCANNAVQPRILPTFDQLTASQDYLLGKNFFQGFDSSNKPKFGPPTWAQYFTTTTVSPVASADTVDPSDTSGNAATGSTKNSSKTGLALWTSGFNFDNSTSKITYQSAIATTDASGVFAPLPLTNFSPLTVPTVQPGQKVVTLDVLARQGGDATPLLQAMCVTNKGSRRRAGVSMDDVPAGVSVLAVEPGSPADRAGVKTGDILVSGTSGANPTPVQFAKTGDFVSFIAAAPDNAPLTMTVVRDGKNIDFTYTPLLKTE